MNSTGIREQRCRASVRRSRRLTLTLPPSVLLAAPAAHASLFSGDTLDAVANALAWIVLFIAPVVAIAVFWMVHILPEKIAEKRKHPQAKAIQTLCLLSLVFGGLLWPLAWLWAYSKPVLHKMAYGTDVGDHEPPAPPSVSEDPPAQRPSAEAAAARDEEI